MKSVLLATQIHIPPQAGQAIPRKRLVDAVETGLPIYKLILVAAPAGYGKTTFLSQWARSSQVPVAWFSLSEAENDIERFMRYMFNAWEQVHPGIRESSLGVMLEGPMADITAVLAGFVNLANEMPEHTAFVLDDYHLIEDDNIHQALTFLLEHLPNTVHLVLSTRADPPLPLARYRARAQILELRTEDLQFGLEETADFFHHLMDLELSGDALDNVQSQLEGWAAGLRLVGLTIRHRPPGSSALIISGKHRFVADYLNQDVIAGLPDDLNQFLLQTSILDRLSGPLCDAVTEKQDGQVTLEKLERENLFLVALDDRREWYRYHHLFGDFLREELNHRYPEQAPELHRRAARWFLDHELVEQAYYHALAADDLELMGLLINRYANAKLQAGEFSDLKRWLDALPPEWYTAYPVLGLARAGYLAYTGAFEECLRMVDEVENRLAHLASEDARQQMARVKAVRCFMACTVNDLNQAQSYAGQALQDLPEEDLGFRPVIYAALGDTYRQNGLWDEARQCYQQALTFTHSPSVRVQSAHVYGALADLDLRQGRLQSAANYWRRALESMQERENWGRLPLPVTGWIYTRTAELLYEWNELEAASDHLARGRERAELGGDVRTQIAGLILAARINQAQGELEKAAEFLEQARPLVEQAPFPEWAARYERCQLELWLAENRLRAAVAWSNEMLVSSVLEERPESEITRLAIARVLIIQGDPPAVERALALLDHLLESARDGGWVGIAIEGLGLQALAYQQRGDGPAALAAIEPALRMAETEGYLRLFADLGLPMARLLQEVHSRGIMHAYVEKLLEVFESDLSAPAATGQKLPEALSSREQEILELLAAGLTNREIAEQCVISPETVKKHVSSIAGKLGVSNRTEAAARARSLGLLD
jgi:LuxR family transcriptional regulator, maltose regulon positive regulatory protein